MGTHPFNLFIRFLLELECLIITGLWAWGTQEGVASILMGIGVPLIMAIVWGIFNVPEDPSRSGKAPVIVKGWVRLLLELMIFGTGVACHFAMDYRFLGLAVLFIILLHYAFSYDRIQWLIKR